LPETIGFTVASGPGPSVGNLNLQTQVLCAIPVLNACPKLEIVDQNLPGTPVVSGSPPPIPANGCWTASELARTGERPRRFGTV
jgi:hypothetical protein